MGPDEAGRLADLICGDSGGMLMVIDQFEELFTLSQRRAQERFLETLAAVVDPTASRVRAVMAMRADFYGICATFPWLAKRITANQVLVLISLEDGSVLPIPPALRQRFERFIEAAA